MNTINFYSFRKQSNKVLPKISMNMINNPYKDNSPKTDRNLNKFAHSLFNNNNNINVQPNESKEKNTIVNLKSSKINRMEIKHPSLNLNLNKNNMTNRKSFSFSNKYLLNNKNLLDISTIYKDKDFFKSKFLKDNKNNLDSKHAKRFSLVISRNSINDKLGLSTTNMININSSNNTLLNLKNLGIRENKKMKTLSTRSINKKLSDFSNIHQTQTKKEVNNPFKVEEEDKIFYQLRKKKKKKKKKFYKHSKTPLSKVYKKIPIILKQLNKVKKLKNEMNLMTYQNTLLDVGSKLLERDVRQKLNEQFIEIRRSTEKQYDYFEDEIDTIESKEKKIISKINTQQNFFKKIMIENNKSSLIYGVTNKHDNFPKIRFYPTPKNLLYNCK